MQLLNRGKVVILPLPNRLCLQMNVFHFSAILLTASLASVLQGEEPPEWMSKITRKAPGGYADLRPVHLAYTLAWNNRVNAGEFEISIVEAADHGEQYFVGDAKGGSTGFAKLLFPYSFRARSVVEGTTLRPVSFQLSELDRDENNKYDIAFEPDRQIFTTTNKHQDKKAKTNVGGFDFDFGQDVLSSAFYLRSQRLKEGDTVTMVVTPFNRPYIAEFVVTGRESRKVRGKKYKAIKLDAQVGKVNQDLSIKRYDKVKQTTLWVTDDAYRIPLELQSKLAFGFVSARLIDQKWLDGE